MVELREPLESLIAPPSRFTRGTAFPRAREIRLYDTTLRDGEQTPGVAFTPDQKYELAGMLSDAGLHIIDMGFPSAAPSERRALELILGGKKKGRIRHDLEIIVMCRSNVRDIDVTLDTLRNMGAKPSDCTFFIFTSGAMAIEAVLGRHREELAAEGVEVTPQLVQLLLRLVKEVREKKAMVSQHLDGVRNYYAHLERLGLTEEDLVAYALVLGRNSGST